MQEYVRALVVLAGAITLSPAAFAAAIEFLATDLTDITPGQDLWEYQYFVQGTFAHGEGFDIYFPLAEGYEAGDLLTGSTTNNGWISCCSSPTVILLATVFLMSLRSAAVPKQPQPSSPLSSGRVREPQAHNLLSFSIAVFK